MDLVRAAGTHNSYVRCYSVGRARQALHLESARPFQDFNQVIQTVDRFSQPGPFEKKALLFMHQRHLPPDLTSALSGLEGFHQFCKVLAFSCSLYSIRMNIYTPPSSPEDHGNATYESSLGFPAIRPMKNMDPGHPLNFSEQELRGFLGDFFDYAGRLVILRIKISEDAESLLTTYRNLLEYEFLRILEWAATTVAEEPPLLH